ncbi:toll/interleukin-1 receptor domain-containing protein [Nostoc sp.]|uniref:toll/interleukin-1 receptor domain-containing protein n=1 Tax=Nostoc sp. TaxID=1180 RepID=UPI002FFCFDD4
MVVSSKFDVFLVHNSNDKPQVRAIAESLKQRGLSPWLDEEQIPPGRLFQDEIQQAIPLVKSAAIFFGQQGLGNWQAMELRSLITQCIDRRIPVIPVLLPGVNNLPDNLLFLQQFSWVVFSNNLDDEQPLSLLEWGITNTRPTQLPNNSTEKPGRLPTFDDLKQLNNQSPEKNNSYSRNTVVGRLVVLFILSIFLSIFIGVFINQNWMSHNSNEDRVIITENDANNICDQKAMETLKSLYLNPSEYEIKKLEHDSNIVNSRNAWKFVCVYKRKKPLSVDRLVKIEVALDLDGYCMEKSKPDQKLTSRAFDENSDKFLFECVEKS